MRRRGNLRFGFFFALAREIRLLGRQPYLIAGTTVLPALLLALMTIIFSAGLATDLSIAVLDLDGSDLSRTIVRSVDATPDAKVILPVQDLAEGKSAIVSGKVHGLLMLPLNLERDVYAGRRPEVVFFYDTQLMTAGNLVLRGISNAVPTVAGGIRIGLRTSHGQPVEIARASLTPIPVQVNPLFNPTLNYVHFLLATQLPAILQIFVAIMTAYSVGRDAGTPHRLRIMRRLGGGLWRAVAAKLLPFTLIFCFLLAASDGVLFGVFDLPLRGSGWLLMACGLLFVIANQLIGALLALTVGPSAIPLALIITAPAFGFMGIGFPTIAMNGFARFWGGLLPGTWYLTARIDQTVRGTPLDLSLRPVAVLACFVLVGLILVALRLEAMRRATDRKRLRPSGEPAVAA